MIISSSNRSCRGQTALEYLLLLAVVAVVVIASFRPGSLIPHVHDSAQGYYNSVTRVIMGENPAPINGGWCPVTCPSKGSSGLNVMYRSCACPEPAFGGATCTGNTSCGVGQSCNGAQVTCQGVTPCGPCPTGEVCNAAGVCGCSDGLDCSSIPNSAPDSSCTKCNCNSGTFWNASKKTCDSCPPAGNQCATSVDGTSCLPYQCPSNMNCDTTAGSAGYNSCQCNTGTIYTTGPGCVPCAPTSSGDCTTSTDGKTCILAPACAKNMYCDTTVGDPGYNSCQCISGTSWNGTACISGNTCPASLPAYGSPCPNDPNNNPPNVPNGSKWSLVNTPAFCDNTTPCQAYCQTGLAANGACVIMCTGTIPNNAALDPGDPQPTVPTTYNYSTTPAACAFSCNPGYTYSSGQCVAHCLGAVPNNATLDPGDPAPTTPIPYTYFTSPTACAYSCNSGYTYSSGQCTAQCSGTLPSNATLDPGDPEPTTPTAYTYSTTPGACAFSCDSDYTFTSGECIAQCTGTLPNNATLDPGDPQPSTPTAYTYSTTAGACAYSCNTGYSNSSGQCVAQCTGNLPNNTTLNPGDPQPTVPTPYNYSTSSGACSYSCSTGYAFFGQCVAQCTGTLPNGAILNLGNPDPTVPTPYHYATSPAACAFSCKAGDTFSGGQCICTPQCSGKACGSADGCGASCTAGGCTTSYQVCGKNYQGCPDICSSLGAGCNYQIIVAGTGSPCSGSTTVMTHDPIGIECSSGGNCTSVNETSTCCGNCPFPGTQCYNETDQCN